MPTIRGDGPKPPKGVRRALRLLKPLYLALPISLRRHRLFYKHYGTWGNFRHPVSANEKYQWRIINDKRLWLGVTSDKLASKEYARRVALATGLPIKTPETYWVGTDVRELQALAEKLPARWVFKPNHSCGRFRLYDSAEAVDWNELAALGTKWLQPDEEEIALGHAGYSYARKLLFAEQRIGAGSEPPGTCRSHGSGGVAIDHVVSMDAHDDLSRRRTFAYNDRFERIPAGVKWEAAPNDQRSPYVQLSDRQRSEVSVMIGALTRDFDFCRVDYYLDDGFWFGEYAPYSSSGLINFGADRDKFWSDRWPLPDLTTPDPNEPLWRELLSRSERGTLQR